MIIALAAPPIATSIDEGIDHITRMQAEAAAADAHIVCFPEAYLPGLRGTDISVLPFDEKDEVNVLAAIRAGARNANIATIFCHEHLAPNGRQIAATVIDSDGTILGVQTKNQLAPSEDPHYVPGTERLIFNIYSLTFGIVICHEGWRYPETVRWAARRGAQVVFHPHHTGSDTTGVELAQFGDPRAPYYEKAMTMRSIENGIYFASVNQLRPALPGIRHVRDRSGWQLPSALALWHSRPADGRSRFSARHTHLRAALYTAGLIGTFGFRGFGQIPTAQPQTVSIVNARPADPCTNKFFNPRNDSEKFPP